MTNSPDFGQYTPPSEEEQELSNMRIALADHLYDSRMETTINRQSEENSRKIVRAVCDSVGDASFDADSPKKDPAFFGHAGKVTDQMISLLNGNNISPDKEDYELIAKASQEFLNHHPIATMEPMGKKNPLTLSIGAPFSPMLQQIGYEVKMVQDPNGEHVEVSKRDR